MSRWFSQRFFGNVITASAPATPTLTLVDNADGTGAVATVAGADSGTTNTIYVQAVNGELGTSTWTSKGSRTGNGTIAVSLTTSGHYWAYLTSVSSGGTSVSTQVYFVVTSGSDATHYQCLTATQARIQSLTLAGVSNANVIVMKLPIQRVLTYPGKSYPGVLITPTRETMDPKSGTTARDDVGYGVLVSMLYQDNQEPTFLSGLSARLLARQRIAQAFRNQRLPGVTGTGTMVNGWVEPIDVLVPDAWGKNLYASGLLCRFVSRESRGLT